MVEKLTVFQKGLTHGFGQKGPMLFLKSGKKWPFFHLFFLGNIGQENVFYNILERKNGFLAYKNNMFKKSKI